MDNNLARRERAALVTSQAQISLVLAALQAKVEKVGPAQCVRNLPLPFSCWDSTLLN
jgi:hypothetical protein